MKKVPLLHASVSHKLNLQRQQVSDKFLLKKLLAVEGISADYGVSSFIILPLLTQI